MLWWTADLHFGHANQDNTRGILHYCPGRSALWGTDIEAMNRGLVERWNARVAPTDQVIVVGDVAMGKRNETVPWLRACNGIKSLVPGNHDTCWEHGRDGKGTTDSKLITHRSHYHEWGGFADIWPNGKEMWFPELGKVVVSHLPPAECGDHKDGELVYAKEIRFLDKRPPYPEEGTIMLCGHVHETWKRHGRVVNVGVDVWDLAPVSTPELAAYIKG